MKNTNFFPNDKIHEWESYLYAVNSNINLSKKEKFLYLDKKITPMNLVNPEYQ